MNQFNITTPTSATATSALLFSSQPASAPSPRQSKAPWIETGFVQIPLEFYAVAITILSKGAQRLYFLHCKHAQTKGDDAGFSYAYRETCTRELACSLATIDRANAELERHALIRDTGRRFRHGGAVKFQLQPPSKWLFGARKNAPLTAQKCALGDAKTRPITRSPKEKEPKKQQHRERETSPKSAAPDVVVSFPSVHVPLPEPPTPAEETRLDGEAELLRQQVEAVGVKPHVARQLVEKYPRERVAAQMRWLDARNPRSPAAILVKSIHEDWDAPASASVKAPETPQIPAKAPESAQERADREKMALGRLQALQGAAQRAFEGLAPHSQNYARSDMASRAADGKDGSLLATMQSQFDSELHGELRKQKEVRH